jgi:hypothetical protein
MTIETVADHRGSSAVNREHSGAEFCHRGLVYVATSKLFGDTGNGPVFHRRPVSSRRTRDIVARTLKRYCGSARPDHFVCIVGGTGKWNHIECGRVVPRQVRIREACSYTKYVLTQRLRRFLTV